MSFDSKGTIHTVYMYVFFSLNKLPLCTCLRCLTRYGAEVESLGTRTRGVHRVTILQLSQQEIRETKWTPCCGCCNQEAGDVKEGIVHWFHFKVTRVSLMLSAGS